MPSRRWLPGVRVIVAFFALSCGVVPLANAADYSDGAAKQLIVELGLIEAGAPVRDSTTWRKPERVLAWRLPADARAALQAVAPGVEIMSAENPAEYASLAPKADVVLGPCAPAMVSAATQMRWLQMLTAGAENCVSQERIRKGEVLLTNMQRIAAPVMADHVMSMLLDQSRNLPAYREAQRQAKWLDNDEQIDEFGLNGKTLCVAGLGGTGLEVAKRAHAFGMRVTGTRNTRREAPDYVSYVGSPAELPKLLAEADVVVNTLPLTPETRGLFDARMFAAMKDGARFFNVGRGATVVTGDLVQALRSGKLAGAGLDVVDPEPLPADHPLWKLPNVVITPHVAARDERFLHMRWLLARENLRRYVAGERMLSVVDPQRGY